MDIFFDSKFNNFVDRDSGLYASSKTELIALDKSYRLQLPNHEFLSNRYILKKIVEVKNGYR